MPISSFDWQAYPWKNELHQQMDRAIAHGLEFLNDDFKGDHSPGDMLERAFVMAAFSVRRMTEKKLVTDKLANSTRAVGSLVAVASTDFRQPFHRSSGGHAYNDYDFSRPVTINMKVSDLANEIIHSSQFMVLGSEQFAEDGFLVASDWHLKERVLHLSFVEFRSFCEAVLDDKVVMASDSWDPDTGEASSKRR